MKIYSNLSVVLMSALLISSCSQIPEQAHFNRGDPTIQLNYSKERINLSLSNLKSIDELKDWIKRDKPNRAEIACFASAPVCRDAERVLKENGIPVDYANSGSGIALIYEKVLASDCDPSFITNHINPYNLNHPAYGCSIRGNMLQMVSDRKQFTNPAMMGNASGEKAIQAMEGYRQPPTSPDFVQSYSSSFSSN